MCIKVEILTHNIHLSPHCSVHFSFSKIRPWKFLTYCSISTLVYLQSILHLVQALMDISWGHVGPTYCWWTRGRASKWQFAEFSFALPISSLAPLGRDRLLQLHPTRLSFPFCSSQSLLRRSVSQKGILVFTFSIVDILWALAWESEASVEQRWLLHIGIFLQLCPSLDEKVSTTSNCINPVCLEWFYKTCDSSHICHIHCHQTTDCCRLSFKCSFYFELLT